MVIHAWLGHDICMPHLTFISNNNIRAVTKSKI